MGLINAKLYLWNAREIKNLNNCHTKIKHNLIEFFSTKNYRYDSFLYRSLSDSFLVVCQLRSNCRPIHLSFNKLVVNQRFEVRSVTVSVTVFIGAYLFKINDRVELS